MRREPVELLEPLLLGLHLLVRPASFSSHFDGRNGLLWQDGLRRFSWKLRTFVPNIISGSGVICRQR